MTREEAIEFIFKLIYMGGAASKATSRATAERIVDGLVERGALKLAAR